MGKPGVVKPARLSSLITDTSKGAVSPYAGWSRQGATIVPRRLFFVNEAENPAIIQAGQTVTVDPRKGSLDKQPWKNLDLATITGQTIETQHVFDVHLGETVVPYVTFDPLKAILPLKRNDAVLPADKKGVGGVSLGALGHRMRARWQTVSRLWDENKRQVNKLDLLERLDYHGELSSQLIWQQKPGERPIRIAYTMSGTPTAALLPDRAAIADCVLYWVTCADVQESYYLLAVINSDVLFESVASLMPKGQFGARHVHKHLWKLPIPEFDASVALHAEVSEAGKTAAAGAAKQLKRLRQERDRVTVTIARRELRKWLRASDEGQAVEDAVGRLLGGG